MKKKSIIVFILLLVLKNATWIFFFAAFLHAPFHGYIEGGKEAYFSYLGPFWEACWASLFSVLTGALLFTFSYYFLSSYLTPRMTAVILLCDAGWLMLDARMFSMESSHWVLSALRLGIQLFQVVYIYKRHFIKAPDLSSNKGLWITVRISLTAALTLQIISQIYMIIKANNAVISNGAPAVICCLTFIILCLWIPKAQRK